MKPGGGSIMLCAGFSAAGPGWLVMLERFKGMQGNTEGKPLTTLFILEEDINMKKKKIEINRKSLKTLKYCPHLHI